MKVLLGVLFLCGLYSTQSASVNIDQTSRCAGQEDGSYISVPGECSQFYICLHGEGFMNSCGVGLHFDPENRNCIAESRSLCKQGQQVDVFEKPKVEETSLLKDICLGKMTGAFIPSKTSCQEYYVCIGNEPMLKECQAGLHFNPYTRSCIDSELSSCTVSSEIVMAVKDIPEQQQMISEPDAPQKATLPQVPKEVKLAEVKLEAAKPQEVKPEEIRPQEVVPSSVKSQDFIPQEAAPQQVVKVPSTIFAATVCLGQPNGALFPVPGSCSKYFTCLQQRALEQSCGLRHFDSLSRNCIDAFASDCVEGDLGVLFLSTATENGNMLPNSEVVDNTNIGANNNGINIESAKRQQDDNVLASNSDSGASNGASINEIKPAEQLQFVELEPQAAAEQANISVGDTNIGLNNDGIIIGNANLSIRNNGTVSNVNIITASQNVTTGNSQSNSSNTVVISGGKLMANNKIVPIKQTGLPVNKKEVSQVDTMDVVVSNSGISIDSKGVVAASENNTVVGNTNVGASNTGIIIGNANVDIRNPGVVEDVNLVIGSSNVLAGNSNPGGNKVAQNQKEHTELVLAIVDESNPDACVGKASGSLWPKVGSCTQFLTCENDIPYVGECPRGLHFNDQTRSCDWPEFSGCVEMLS